MCESDCLVVLKLSLLHQFFLTFLMGYFILSEKVNFRQVFGEVPDMDGPGPNIRKKILDRDFWLNLTE